MKSKKKKKLFAAKIMANIIYINIKTKKKTREKTLLKKTREKTNIFNNILHFFLNWLKHVPLWAFVKYINNEILFLNLIIQYLKKI
jgi:hypothetical protein